MKSKLAKYGAVPVDLTDAAQWLVWRSVARKGKPAKVPFTAAGPPYRPGSERGLATFAEALARWERGGYDGLGFAFLANDPFVGIDLDWKHLPGEGVPPVARAFVRRFGSYAELSPSGRGLHIIVRGRLPADARRRVDVMGVHVEVYDRDRYFTVTGERLPESAHSVTDAQGVLDAMYAKLLRRPPRPSPNLHPPTNLDDDELLRRAFAARNGDRIRALYYGDTRGYPSRSEADAALAALLAFYTGPDPERLERLMWRSRLARPDKWNSKRAGQTWIQRTVRFAIKSQPRFYQGSYLGRSA